MRRSTQYKKNADCNDETQDDGHSVEQSAQSMLSHVPYYRQLIRLLEAIILTGVIYGIMAAGHILHQMKPASSGLGSGQLQISTGSANLSVTITSQPNIDALVPGDTVDTVLSVKNTGSVGLEPTIEITGVSPALGQYLSATMRACLTGAGCTATSGVVATNVVVAEPGVVLTPGNTVTLNVTIYVSTALPSAAQGTKSYIDISVNGVQP